MDREKWEAVRKKGKNRFIWVNGFIGRGIAMTLSWCLLMAFIRPTDNLWAIFLIALVIFPVSGLLSAYLTWWAMERKYFNSNNNF